MAFLQVSRLQAYYGKTQALHGLDFELEEGGITTILGLATHRVSRPFVFFRKKATHGSKTYSSVRRALARSRSPADYKQRQILSSPLALALALADSVFL